MAKLHSKKGAFFFKYFFIFSGIILVSFLVLGFALMLFFAGFLRNSLLVEMRDNASKVSATIMQVVDSPFTERNPEGAAITIYKTMDVMADSTDCDIFVCNKHGNVIACADSVSGTFDVNTASECENHKNVKIESRYIQQARSHGFAEFSTFGRVYDDLHAVALDPIMLDGEFFGFTVVSTPITGRLWTSMRDVMIMFIVAAGIALILVTVAVFFMTERIAKPIRNLETATRCYSSGDFSYKVPELNTNDELADLITKFNAMAVSLSQLEDSRRSFVANVSHEFKTPMTTIGGFINGILDGTIPPEKQSYYLEIVSSEISRLSKMVNMMLNISKIETGNIDIKPEKLDISQKLVTVFLGFEQLISKKNIDVSGFEDLPQLTVRGDSAMIDQVVYNLADNAVKFTDENGKIRIDGATDKHYVYFSITNSGKGIQEKDLPQVFERFFKGDKSRSTDVKSTGLGLYLVRTIVELHGGTITVESKPDDFTRFTVKLPK